MLRLSFIILCVVPGVALHAAELTFEKDIRPIFRAHCFDCHGATDTLEGNLDLRLVKFLEKGGDSGPAIVKGNVRKSLFLERIRDREMPPGEHPVPAEQFAILAAWVKQGAKTARPEPKSIGPGLGISEEEKAYWFFQPITRPGIPTVKAFRRIRTPIDAFLLHKLEQQTLTFAADADRTTLVRRAYLDLWGLPPTTEQVTAFITDRNPNAWPQLIDKLLKSPHYGERWGRHWLDVAGYADSEGNVNRDDVRSWAYKYRDWVIRAFNDDMPFDQFITWQLAGDELVHQPYKNMSPNQIDKLTATGFLRMAADATQHVDTPENRNQVMIDTVKIVSSSLLGMSVGCAQCHDHRYDPISQEDYYRLRATFEPALNWRKWKKPSNRFISLYTDTDIAQAAKTEKEAVTKIAEKTAKQKQYMDEALQQELARHEDSLRKPLESAYRTTAKERTAEQNALLAKFPSVASFRPGVLYQYNQKHADELKQFDTDIAAIRAKKPRHEYVRALTEVNVAPVTAQFFYRGDYRQPQHNVNPGGLTIATAAVEQAALQIPINDTSRQTTGRRLTYAKSLTSGQHPMLARVLVNRFWMNHFGQTFVSTPDEFGKLGSLPTHPELLDWLATQFTSRGWSVKDLHRLIMTSTVYMQQSTRTPLANRVDGSNTLYGHFPVHRLDAEAIRDSILAVSGRLDRTQFGPAVAVSTDDSGQVIIKGDTQRRSVYVQSRRTQPLAILTSFDAPAMDVNCAKRQSSTVATQSLMLMNSDFILESSKAFAQHLQTSAAGKVDSRLIAGFKINVTGIATTFGSPWDYGYGFITKSNQSRDVSPVKFTRYPYFKDDRWLGSETFPDPVLGFSFLYANGGHPQTEKLRPIRRWKSPANGRIRIQGTLGRPSKASDGVHLTVYHSRLGQIAECTTPTGNEQYNATTQVRTGDIIDTIVDERTKHTSDSFTNAFTIQLLDGSGKLVRTWDSKAEFSGPKEDIEYASNLPEQIAHAWHVAYGKPPQREDVVLAVRFVTEQLILLYQNGTPSPVLQAMTNYCQSLLSSNRFLYVE